MDGSSDPAVSLPDAGDMPGTRCAPASATSSAGAGEMGYRERSAILLAAGAMLLCMAKAQATEWRSWCGQPGSGASLGWHFYCDRQDRNEERAAPQPAAPSGDAGSVGDRAHPGNPPDAGGGARRSHSRPDTAQGGGLSPPPAGNPAARRRLLRRLPAHGLGDARTRLHAEAPGRRPRQAGLVGPAPAGPRSGARPSRRALRPDLSRPCRLQRLQGVRPLAARLRDPPRPRRARGLALRRGAGGLAGGGGGQRPGRPARARRALPSRPWCCSTRRRNGCCRSATASWPRTRWRSGYTRSPPWSPDMTIRKSLLHIESLQVLLRRYSVRRRWRRAAAGAGVLAAVLLAVGPAPCRRALGDEPLLAGRGGQHHRPDRVPGPGLGPLDPGQPLSAAPRSVPSRSRR